MLPRCTIKPHRLLILNRYGKSRYTIIPRLDGHMPRMDSRQVPSRVLSVGVVAEREAGCVEGGLGHGVVTDAELELDHVADGGFEVVGCEC